MGDLEKELGQKRWVGVGWGQQGQGLEEEKDMEMGQGLEMGGIKRMDGVRIKGGVRMRSRAYGGLSQENRWVGRGGVKMGRSREGHGL